MRGEAMSIIRVELAEEFMLGDDVVLVAMDGDGVAEFTVALEDAQRQGSWEFDQAGCRHQFSIASGQSAVDLEERRVHWRLDQAKVGEMIDALKCLSDGGRPGHQYVDISQPVDTLVLSRDEYV